MTWFSRGQHTWRFSTYLLDEGGDPDRDRELWRCECGAEDVRRLDQTRRHHTT